MPSRLGRSASKSPANCCTNGCRSTKAAESWPRDAGHGGVTRGAEGAPRFRDWPAVSEPLAELGAARVSERNVLTGEGRVEALGLADITASAFPLTRVSPLLGRPLQATDELQGAEPVVVLGYDVWQKQFLHDPGDLSAAS